MCISISCPPQRDIILLPVVHLIGLIDGEATRTRHLCSKSRLSAAAIQMTIAPNSQDQCELIEHSVGQSQDHYLYDTGACTKVSMRTQ